MYSSNERLTILHALKLKRIDLMCFYNKTHRDKESKKKLMEVMYIFMALIVVLVS
jgi:hypothetical protein